ncbi:beta-lactamase family protein [Pseudooceanicola sp. CBS1P-1]|uniref:Serine hydrolase n=1 Tax=Pseudooceanicola albus TaxID=2692189 RepID=A0A6L7G597_9RHOB|nr:MULTISPECIES: serine hydrolase domain-containing protein [Pseudooceanicola]MBT9385299.1 beta-lactamase family protein [Pseudooceanicola endophyticus]MXN18842.1 serine hydrolase [Pseudooceanicola albus]
MRPNTNRKTLVLAAAGLAMMAGAAQAGSCDVDFSAGVDSAIDSAIRDDRIVGAVVMIMKDGKLVYSRAAGLADREANIPMAEDAIFRLSSVSKSFVTTAALALVKQGKLSLEDPVTKYLPDFKPALADGSTPPILISQLLSHTAGLGYGLMEQPDGPYHKAGVSDGLDEVDIGMDEEMKRISAAGLAYPPGKGWAYSVAVDVMGAVIEKITGEPLPQAVDQLVSKPLGLTDTGFSTQSDRLTAAYYNTPDGAKRMVDPQLVTSVPGAAIRFSPSRARKDTPFPSGGAGMVSSAGDVLKLLETLQEGGGDILTPALTTQMMQNQIGDLPVSTNGPGYGFGFGGKVLLDPVAAKTPQPKGTYSWGGVYGHTWFIDPVCHITAVEMTNTGLEGLGGKFPADVADAIYGATVAN